MDPIVSSIKFSSLVKRLKKADFVRKGSVTTSRLASSAFEEAEENTGEHRAVNAVLAANGAAVTISTKSGEITTTVGGRQVCLSGSLGISDSVFTEEGNLLEEI